VEYGNRDDKTGVPQDIIEEAKYSFEVAALGDALRLLLDE
jgi:hypothetical protein